MNDLPTIRQELASLLDTMVDSGLDPAQQARLNELLRTHVEARRDYRDYLALHATMFWEAQEQAGVSRQESGVTGQELVSFPYQPPTILSSHRSSPVLGFLARTTAALNRPVIWSVLGVGLLFAGYFVAISWDMFSAKLAKVATIVDSADVQWSNEAKPADADIRKGEPLKIALGFVELKLKQGTILLVEGPAEWTIDGDNQASLRRGKLVARVPQQAIGFTLDTPTARIVDLGTEFAAQVSAEGQTEVHVLQGQVETTSLNKSSSDSKATRLAAGQALLVPAAEKGELQMIAVEPHKFALSKSTAARRPAPLARFAGAIPLGNLFDDRAPVSLTDAVASDTWSAAPDRDHLGIERVYSGGDAVKEIAPGIRFDFAPLGWLGKSYSPPVNDAVCLERSSPSLPIRTTGKSLASRTGKLEDGIGMHADSAITFNLDEIRRAGALDNSPLRFVCERVGLNDSAVGKPNGSVHCLAIVSDNDRVLAAYLDGTAIKTSTSGNVCKATDPPGKPFKADGRFAQLAIDLPSTAKYLTLAVTAAGDNIHVDHGVWSNTRLETANAQRNGSNGD